MKKKESTKVLKGTQVLSGGERSRIDIFTTIGTNYQPSRFCKGF